MHTVHGDFGKLDNIVTEWSSASVQCVIPDKQRDTIY